MPGGVGHGTVGWRRTGDRTQGTSGTAHGRQEEEGITEPIAVRAVVKQSSNGIETDRTPEENRERVSANDIFMKIILSFRFFGLSLCALRYKSTTVRGVAQSG